MPGQSYFSISEYDGLRAQRTRPKVATSPSCVGVRDCCGNRLIDLRALQNVFWADQERKVNQPPF
jgi:hypothetical protein